MPNIADYIEFTNTSGATPAKIELQASGTLQTLFFKAEEFLEMTFNKATSGGRLTMEAGGLSVASFEDDVVVVQQLTFLTDANAVVTDDGSTNLVVEASGALSIDSDGDAVASCDARSGSRDADIVVYRDTTLVYEVKWAGNHKFWTDVAMEGGEHFNCLDSGLVAPTANGAPSSNEGDGDLRVETTTNDETLHIYYNGAWRSLAL